MGNFGNWGFAKDPMISMMERERSEVGCLVCGGEKIRFQVGVSVGPSRMSCAYFENGTHPAFVRVCGDLRGLLETREVTRM